MPRIAAAMATLLTVSFCIGFNTIRYPVVRQMLSGASAPRSVDTSETAGPTPAVASAARERPVAPPSIDGQRPPTDRTVSKGAAARRLGDADPIPAPEWLQAEATPGSVRASIAGSADASLARRSGSPADQAARQDEPGAWARLPEQRAEPPASTADAPSAPKATAVDESPSAQIVGTEPSGTYDPVAPRAVIAAVSPIYASQKDGAADDGLVPVTIPASETSQEPVKPRRDPSRVHRLPAVDTAFGAMTPAPPGPSLPIYPHTQG